MSELALLEKFDDVKEIADLLNDIQTVQVLYCTNQYTEMREFVKSLMTKYSVKNPMWVEGSMNTALTDRQAYVNGALLLRVLGAKIITEDVPNYQERLTVEEMFSLEALLQSGYKYL